MLSLKNSILTLLLLATSLGSAWANPTVQISGNPEAPPVVWEKSGLLTGAGPEMIQTILTKLGVQASIQPAGSWSQVLDKAKSGDIDMIVSSYKTKKREEFLEYSSPYLESPVIVVIKKGDTFLCNCWDDMVGKRGVANTGESFGDEFDSFIAEKLNVTYTSYSRAFEMLAEDTADYLIIDLYPAIIYSKLLMAEDKVEFIEKPITVQQIHLAFSKKSPHLTLLPQINKEIALMKKEGAIKQLALEQYKKWNKTIKERQRFYDRSNQKAKDIQVEFDSGAKERGFDNMARFLQRDIPYMDGSNFSP